MNVDLPRPLATRVAREARTIARLGVPLLANNLAVAGMSLADTVMAGRLGARDLAAVAIGSSYFNLYLFVGLGVLMAMSPVVAHAFGAGDDRGVSRYFAQALWLVAGLTVLLISGLLCARAVLTVAGVDRVIVPAASGYVLAIACGMPGLLGFFALRFTSEGLGWTRPIMYIAVLGLIVNVIGNWIFMYGRLGAPRLGAVGCGVASAIMMWVMCLTMLAYMRRHRVYRSFGLFDRLVAPRWDTLREILAIGLPIAGSIVSEGGLFVAAALIMGTLGATVVAAHQIAINYSTFMFMVPLAIHSATTIHVGHLLGSGERRAARFAGFTGVGLCGGVMLISALVLLGLRDGIAALYTGDTDVRVLAAGMLLMAAIFQVSDGLQVGAAGALRGFKDTRIPMMLNLFSYWVIGFPVAYVLGIVEGGGPILVWAGLVAGLTVCAVLLLLRLSRVSHVPPGAASPGAAFAASGARVQADK